MDSYEGSVRCVVQSGHRCRYSTVCDQQGTRFRIHHRHTLLAVDKVRIISPKSVDNGRFLKANHDRISLLTLYTLSAGANLSSPNIETLRSSKKLAAIIAVINGTDPVYSLSARPKTIVSPDTSCPNCEFGLYANTPNQYQWNPSVRSQKSDRILQDETLLFLINPRYCFRY